MFSIFKLASNHQISKLHIQQISYKFPFQHRNCNRLESLSGHISILHKNIFYGTVEKEQKENFAHIKEPEKRSNYLNQHEFFYKHKKKVFYNSCKKGFYDQMTIKLKWKYLA